MTQFGEPAAGADELAPESSKSGIDPRMEYREARRAAASEDRAVRLDLAKRTDLQPEVLYYLAEDEEAGVRQAVAENQSTPRQADAMLVDDVDDDVRISLARKISRLAPGLNTEAQSWLHELTLKILDDLSRDELPRVRRIIAEEIRHLDNLPHELIRRLAEDAELTVCAPILEYSSLLSDDDLLEIMALDPVKGALSAISARENLGFRPSDAISHSDDNDAVARLLANPSAQIREETLDHIVARAPEQRSWHDPLVRRDDLSHRAIKHISRFVTSSLLSVLAQRYDLEDDTTIEIAEAVDERQSANGLNEDGLPAHRAADLYEKGMLNDDSVLAAIGRGDRQFLNEALALKTGFSPETVGQVLSSQSPRILVALCWKAGLSMRTAFQAQLKIALIPSGELISAKDGLHYPFGGAEMREILRFISD
ncbi:MAG: DUF2336 domain-containing protein [Proteobacteria bacterium]|nr:DUF2336 domain-containing protein [Pseudomonadota bacterium]MDA1355497.1 DUF2336 domain-containing protein [Pseudomonadota bacterium]